MLVTLETEQDITNIITSVVNTTLVQERSVLTAQTGKQRSVSWKDRQMDRQTVEQQPCVAASADKATIYKFLILQYYT